MPAPMRPPPSTPTSDGAPVVGHRFTSVLPLEELGHASELLGALEQHGLRLEVDGGVRGARRAEHALRRDGRGAVVAGDAIGDRVRGGQQLVGRVQLGHEPDLERLVGADRATGEQQLDRARLADDLLQAPARAGRGDDAEPGLGVADAAARGVAMRMSAA